MRTCVETSGINLNNILSWSKRYHFSIYSSLKIGRDRLFFLTELLKYGVHLTYRAHLCLEAKYLKPQIKMSVLSKQFC